MENNFIISFCIVNVILVFLAITFKLLTLFSIFLRQCARENKSILSLKLIVNQCENSTKYQRKLRLNITTAYRLENSVKQPYLFIKDKCSVTLK